MIHLIAVNIRSAHNVGAFLRTADALGITKIWLTGYTPKGDHPDIAKTALGAEKSVAWEHIVDPIVCMEQLKKDGIRIIGLECGANGVLLNQYQPEYPCAIVVGNEVEGLSKLHLAACDDIVEIPQKGAKESLNVSVAAGIALWHCVEKSSHVDR